MDANSQTQTDEIEASGVLTHAGVLTHSPSTLFLWNVQFNVTFIALSENTPWV